MILSADTNLFLYAANPDSPYHEAAQRFFEESRFGWVDRNQFHRGPINGLSIQHSLS
jgi:hypothetical protein